MLRWSRSCEVSSALPADASLRAVGVELVTDTGRMALGTQQRDVRHVDRHVAVDDAALHRGPGRLLMLLGDVDAVDDHATLRRKDTRHVAFLAAVFTREDADAVTLLDLEPRHLQHLRRERNDAHELLVAQLTADGAEDARAARLLLVVDQHGRVLVEADVAAVGTAPLLLHPDDDALHDVAFLDLGARDGVFDRGDEDVADRRVAPLRASEHLDAEDLFGAAVVRDAKTCLLLDHRARSNTSTRRQRFSFDSGRVSCTRTRSPTLRSLFSSCT